MIPELAKREGRSPAKYHTQQETPITFLVTHLIISSGKLHWAEWIALSVTNSPALGVSTSVTERPNISRPLPNKPSYFYVLALSWIYTHFHSPLQHTGSNIRLDICQAPRHERYKGMWQQWLHRPFVKDRSGGCQGAVPGMIGWWAALYADVMARINDVDSELTVGISLSAWILERGGRGRWEGTRRPLCDLDFDSSRVSGGVRRPALFSRFCLSWFSFGSRSSFVSGLGLWLRMPSNATITIFPLDLFFLELVVSPAFISQGNWATPHLRRPH